MPISNLEEKQYFPGFFIQYGNEEPAQKNIFSLSNNELHRSLLDADSLAYFSFYDLQFLFNKLTLEQILQVFSVHERLATEALKNESLCKRLTIDQLVLLGSHHLEAAKLILNKPKVCKKLDSYSLSCLGQNNPDIANHILSMPTLTNKMGTTPLALMGKKIP